MQLDLSPLTQHIRSELHSQLGILQPFVLESGRSGELYGIIDLADTLDDDPEVPGLSGSAALRVAKVGSGNIILTTFLKQEYGEDYTRELCGTRFMELALKLEDAIPQVSSASFGQHLTFRKLSLAGRSERSLSQARKGEDRSLWTISCFTPVNLHLIIRQNVMARKLELK